MLLWISKTIGQGLSDVYESAAYVGNEIIDAPGALYDGWNEGGIIDPNGSEDEQKEEVKAEPKSAPTEADIRAQIRAELIAEMNAEKDTSWTN